MVRVAHGGGSEWWSVFLMPHADDLSSGPSCSPARARRVRTHCLREGVAGCPARAGGKTDAKDISRTFTKEPVASQAVGVEAIFAALFLAPENSASSQAAFDRLWFLQMREGKAAGAWSWF